MIRRPVVVGLVVVLVVAGLLVPALPAAGHGIPDQGSGPSGTSGDCSTAEFPGSKSLTTGESRQSFVPTHHGLASVDVCIGNLIGILGTDFTVHLYEGEAALTQGGTPLASVPVDAGSSLLTAQWVHVEFPLELATTPGATYVIGIAPAVDPDLLSSVTFQWRSTCVDDLLTSCEGVPDAYGPGRANDLPRNADYGFRSFGLEDADLFGAVTVDEIVCPGLDLADAATGTVTNQSTRAVGAFTTQWVFSTDAALGAGDRTIGAPTELDGLEPGAAAVIPPPILPGNLPHGDGHLLLHLDVHDTVIEIDDANNVVAAPTTVTACGQPAITGLALTVDEDQIPTGFHQRQFDDLDPAALASLPQSRDEAVGSPAVTPNGLSPNGLSPNGLSPNGLSPNGLSPNGLSPNGLSPNGLSPNGLSPNGLSPASGIPLAELADDLPAGLLEQLNVVNIPIVDPSWDARLEPFTDEPIQNVTLARALQLLPQLHAGEIDLSFVLTASWLSLATANVPLDRLPLPDGRPWCVYLADNDFDCAATGLDPAVHSLLYLEAKGFPAFDVPVASQVLGAVDLSGAAVNAFRLTGTPRFNLEHTRLGQLGIGVLLANPDAVVDCAAFGCQPDDARTLVEAAAAGAIRDVSVGTLLANLTQPAADQVPLGDLAQGTATVSTLRLATANWNLADAFQMDGECPRMTYRVVGDNTGSAAAVDPTITVTLARGFTYVPGTATFAHDGGGAAPAAEPSVSVGADGTRTLTFEHDGIVDGPFEQTLQACASVYLGTFDAGAATASGVGLGGPYEASTDPAAADRITTIERTPGVTTVPIDPDPATPGADDNVVITDHIATAGDHDSFTFPVSSVPRTMYIVRLFPPTGVDYDLIAFGPAASANRFTSDGFSPNGLSPNGLSPNGLSPNGLSPNGLSPNGLSPNGLSPNGLSPNGLSPNGLSYTAQPDGLDDVPVQELRPGSDAEARPYLVSANRGDTPETLYFFSNFGDEGEYTLSVADYNGVRSDAPYFMTVQTVQPDRDPRLAACQAAPFAPLTVPAQAAPITSTWASPRTLFLTNRQVATSMYDAAGTTDTTAGMESLETLAGRPEIRGLVVEVDGNPTIAQAYNRWRTGDNWCQPTVANEVAVQIRNLVLDLRTRYPSIDTIVLAGGDPVVPDFRLPDVSSMGNENQYIEPLLNATGGNNALVAAFADATITTADPYGNDGALRFGEGFALPPSAGVSRLPEGPLSWVEQVQQYTDPAVNGDLSPTSAMIAAYDGMVDGAHAAADVLSGRGLQTDRLTDEAGSWTAADFRREAFTEAPGFAGYNAHANHWTILSDAGSDTGDVSDVVTTAEAAEIPTGSLVFSNGCHFGTSVTDALNTSPDAAERVRLNDWNQAVTGQQGIAVTNSGFGIFDTVEVGQGERLQQLFLERLQVAPNASLALAQAKNIFLATVGVQDAYSFKTAHQLQMYGLGIFKMAGASRDPQPVTRPPATASTPVSFGPYTVAPAGTTTCQDCYLRQETPAGTAFDLVDGDVRPGHTSAAGYWSAPLLSDDVPRPIGMSSAGLWITGRQAQRLDGVDPVVTRLALNRPDRETESQTSGSFPAAVAQVADVGPVSYVTALLGVSRSTGLVNGEVRSQLYLTTGLQGDILYRPEATPGCRSHIDEVTRVHPAQSTIDVVDVVVSDRCGPVQRVALLAMDGAGNTVYRELGLASGHWSTSIPAASTDVFVQAFNGSMVSYWHNKVDHLLARAGRADPGLSVSLAGPRHASGIYTGAVVGTLNAPAGALCQVFENDHVLGTFVNGQTFTIAGDGSHEVSVHCNTGSVFETSLAIDATGPTITLVTPPPNTTYRVGDGALVDVVCSDPGTGTSCVVTNDGVASGDGAALRTGTAGTHTVVVTATDAVGNRATLTRSYAVAPRYTISNFFSPIQPRPQLNVVSPASNIAVKFTVRDFTGAEVTDVAVIAQRLWYPIHCTSKARTGTPFNAVGTTPEYSGFFHFNVSAPTTLACFELVVVLTDGTQQSAYFRVKR